MKMLTPISGLADLVWPPRCVACGARIPPVDADDAASMFCVVCAESLIPIASPRCPRCALPFEGVGPDHLCGECLKDAPAFSKGSALFQYGEAAAEAVMRLKYGPMPHLAPVMGRAMLSLIRALSPIDAIIPVPLHRSRLVRRGFNQSVLLAIPVARALGIPLRGDLLVRRRRTLPQAGLSRDERMTNLHGAFEPRKKKGIAGSRILLVDDVITTGATMREISRALVRAGAAQVVIAAFTRAC